MLRASLTKRTTAAMAKSYGKWSVDRPLGEGGQAWTHMVSAANGETGVLKVLKNSKRDWRFGREIEALARLSSSHVPALLDSGETDGRLWLVSGYAGRPLTDELQRLDLSARLKVFRDITNAIADAHQARIVHRDVKPSNVVVQGNVGALVDFGICALSDSGPSHTGVEGFGNSLFAAPECVIGHELRPGYGSDVYSAGKILYWLLSDGDVIYREDLKKLGSALARLPGGLRSRVVSLIYACVREPLHGRPDAATLLGRAELLWNYAKELTHEFAQHRIRVVDNIDGDDFNRTSNKAVVSATFKRTDLHPSHQVIGDIQTNTVQAERLQNPFEDDMCVVELALGLGCITQSGAVDVHLASDSDGTSGTPLMVPHRIDLQFGHPKVYRLACSARVAPGPYWIVVRPGSEPSYANVYVASWNVAPQDSRFAESYDGGSTWEVRHSPTGPGIAVRVTVAKEPA